MIHWEHKKDPEKICSKCQQSEGVIVIAGQGGKFVYCPRCSPSTPPKGEENVCDKRSNK